MHPTQRHRTEEPWKECPRGRTAELHRTAPVDLSSSAGQTSAAPTVVADTPSVAVRATAAAAVALTAAPAAATVAEAQRPSMVFQSTRLEPVAVLPAAV